MRLPTSDEAEAMIGKLKELKGDKPFIPVVLPGETLDILVRHVVAKAVASSTEEEWPKIVHLSCLDCDMKSVLNETKECFTLGISVVSYVRGGGRVIFVDPKESEDEHGRKENLG